MATPIPENAVAFTAAELVQVTGGALEGAVDAVHGVVIDSRAVKPGRLFVAVRGERLDGHAFVLKAAEAGAACAVVEATYAGPAPKGLALLRVADTTRALGDLARFHRRRWGGVVVGIGGSAGKTTTKDLTAAAIAADGTPVLKTKGNLNNLFGVPMTLFELTQAVTHAVIEIGTSLPGEVARLAAIAEPNVAVITLVAPEHLEGLGTLAAVAEEEAALLRALEPEGVAIANGDVAVLAPWLNELRARTVWRYGRAPGADLELLSFDVDESLHTQCMYRFHADGRAVAARISMLGEAAAMNVAAALSVVHALGKSVDTAIRALETIPATDGRMHPYEGVRGTLVLDDTYNANPRSMDIAIETAAALAARRNARVVAVLGTMAELGPTSREHHLLVGERVAAERVPVFVGCGEAMRPAVDLARSLGVADCRWVEDAIEARATVETLLERGDVLLVKGSRSMAMERVVAAFRAPGDAA